MRTHAASRLIGGIFIFIATLHFPVSSYGEGSCVELFQVSERPSSFVKVARKDILLFLAILKKQTSIEADAISKNQSPSGRQMVKDALKTQATPSEIYFYVTEVLREDWNYWLKDVEISLRPGPRNPFFNLSQIQIIKLLQALDAVIDVNTTAIHSDKSAAGRKVIADTTGLDAPAAYLYNYITQSRKENWTDWLAKAGLSDRDARSNPFAKLPDSQIIPLIKALDKVILVNKSNIAKDKSEVGRKVILEKTGIDSTASQFYNYLVGVKEDSWRDWLDKARLSHRHLGAENPFKSLSESDIVKFLPELDKKTHINAGVLQADKSIETSKSLLKLTGHDGTGAQLYNRVVDDLGLSWNDLLRKANLDHRILRDDYKWPDEKIVQAIQSLAEGGYELNYLAMAQNDSIKAGFWIKQQTGRYITPAKLLDQVRKKEKPDEHIWDYWLVKAGQNPLEIRLRGATPLFLLNAALKGQFDSDYSAIIQGGRGLEYSADGKASPILIAEGTPETALARRDFYEALRRVITDLTPRQMHMFDLMLNYFEIHSYSDTAGMGDYLRTELKPPPSNSEWQGLLVEIAKHEELRELLLDTF